MGVKTMRSGLLSDHLFNKPYRLISALRVLRGVDALLLVGDIVNSGRAEQFELAPCGAFYIRLSEGLDLVGLNPLYYQKMFLFPKL